MQLLFILGLILSCKTGTMALSSETTLHSRLRSEELTDRCLVSAMFYVVLVVKNVARVIIASGMQTNGNPHIEPLQTLLDCSV
jgi:hypothetical protein